MTGSWELVTGGYELPLECQEPITGSPQEQHVILSMGPSFKFQSPFPVMGLMFWCQETRNLESLLFPSLFFLGQNIYLFMYISLHLI